MDKLSFLKKGNTGSMSFREKRRHNPRLMVGIYMVAVFIFFVIVLARLFHLTVVKGVYYRGLSDSNRAREVILEPKRGSISDRKGQMIVSNVEASTDLVTGRALSNRNYSDASVVGNLLGYRQLADDDDLLNDSCINKLKHGDKTGKKGIEKLFDCELRGVNGQKLIEVDALGKFSKTLSILEPKDGQDLQLALDLDLQKKASELMVGKKGAIVGIIPKTGEVLLLFSSPTYDPQVFENSDSKKIESYFVDKEKPLFDRTLEGAYPPGSVFKPFISVAGLEEKKITPEETIVDNGTLKAGPLIFHNWYFLEYGKTDGEVNMTKAIQRSNDIYFYQLGAKLGPDKMRKWAEDFGFHNKTRIGIEEAIGIVPSPFWKEDVLGEKWFTGDTYNMSIGQGYLTTTPMQIAVATSVFANGGKLCKPKILKNGTVLSGSPDCKKIPMKASTYDVVREGMKMACETGGTGWPFFDFAVDQPSDSEGQLGQRADQQASPSAVLKKRIEVGCKTGTAESFSASGKPHSWFTVFAPFDNPEIVLTILVEEGGQGSDVAAPIAKDILKVYFERSE